MLFKDLSMLQEAYLSISKPQKTLPPDEEKVSLVPKQNEVGETPAPMGDTKGGQLEMTGQPTSDSKWSEMASEPSSECGCESELQDEEAEEDYMVIDNLNSTRESILKIAMHWSAGGHLHTWQQQKLAIAMNSLAEIARSLH